MLDRTACHGDIDDESLRDDKMVGPSYNGVSQCCAIIEISDRNLEAWPFQVCEVTSFLKGGYLLENSSSQGQGGAHAPGQPSGKTELGSVNSVLDRDTDVYFGSRTMFLESRG